MFMLEELTLSQDIGESFRPVAHPYLVKGAYAVSWLYLGGDVTHEGYKACEQFSKIYPSQWQCQC